MGVSQRKGGGEVPSRQPDRREPGHLAGACVSCGCHGGGPRLDSHGVCAECRSEGAFARCAVAALIDRGRGVGRSELEAL